MRGGDARKRYANLDSTEAGRSHALTSLLVWTGTALLLLASLRMAPFVRSRLARLPGAVLPGGEADTPSHLLPAYAPERANTGSGPTGAPTSGPSPQATQEVSGNPAGSLEASDAPGPPTGDPPTRLRIPAISVDAPVIAVRQRTVSIAGTPLALSAVPATRAAGWHEDSAPLGVPGNTVLNGHNTGRGEVFRSLYKLAIGDSVIVYSGDSPYPYTVSEVLLLQEAGQPLQTRRRNARYIEPTADDRLTLVTCHPYGSLRYRLIVIARPDGKDSSLPFTRVPRAH